MAKATDNQRSAAATLTAKAQAALAVNASFLANTSPSNPQVLAQVRQLTRQNNALIRLLLASFGDASHLVAGGDT